MKAWAGAALLIGAACSSPSSHLPPTHPLTAEELALRHRLGVPDSAEQVMLFAQTSHLDIDWQRTFDEYYDAFVGQIFTEARQILDAQPRAYYSIAEMAFLERHLAAHPEELPALRAAAGRGALRIVGGGMTSPDTLLPESELLFRDFLYGIQIAEDALAAHPRAAWLPDSFGHGATAPDVLAAAGFSSVAFSRIDGAPTLFYEIFKPSQSPLPGSTAESLQNLGSADFLWQGSGGAAILAHFMPGFGLYCQGDNIDYDENLEPAGMHTGAYHGDDPAFTDGQIDLYRAQLAAYARTPYLFVPVGCDFQHPKEQLIAYLDGYNQRRYPATGAWAVAAPFDDYAQLVSSWTDVLPRVQNELSPYFMGFYGSRAGVKRAARDAARPFFTAETFAAALGEPGRAIVDAAAPDLRKLTRADHHDFVTGTSSDAVARDEQMPLLAAAQRAGEAELSQVAQALSARIAIDPGAVGRVMVLNASGVRRTAVAEVDLPAGTTTAAPMEPSQPTLRSAQGPSDGRWRLKLVDLPPFSWRALDIVPGVPTPPEPEVTLQQLESRVVLANARVRAQWDADAGGWALTSLTIDGVEAIAGPSMLIGDYDDTGGLWRLGHEMAGCVFSSRPPTSARQTVQVLDNTGLLVRVQFADSQASREVWLGAGDAGLSLAVDTGAAQATTRTVSFALAVPADARLRTSSPGGSVERPAERVYSPTFWPAVAWVQAGGWAILLRQSTGARMSTPGAVELMAARDARMEQCDVEGGTGSDTDRHRIEWRIERAARPADAELAAQAFNRPVALQLVGTGQAAATDLPAELSLASAADGAVISAIKPAERGGGVILRVMLMTGPSRLQVAPFLVGRAMTVVDLAERDGRALGPAGDVITLDAARLGSIATIRLRE